MLYNTVKLALSLIACALLFVCAAKLIESDNSSFAAAGLSFAFAAMLAMVLSIWAYHHSGDQRERLRNRNRTRT